MSRIIPILFLSVASAFTALGQVNVYRIDRNDTRQTMHSFGASDAWRTEPVGRNWPLEKREQMADWLFSCRNDKDGNPLGIGLSLWRFNIGSGSFEQGEKSGIANTWNRIECFRDSLGGYDFTKQTGQQWFLNAAKRRGVDNFLAFTIAPPYYMSRNGKTTSPDRQGMNIREDMYDDYAEFLVDVMAHFEKKKGIRFNYVSPVNEPQWDWNTTRQEGTYATNGDCYKLIGEINSQLTVRSMSTQIVFGEAGAIKYLYGEDASLPHVDNQIEEFYSKDGAYSLTGVERVRNCVSGHSYWSTWSVENMIKERQMLASKIRSVNPLLEYWQTEYCMMENNPETKGGWGRDLCIDMALYLARIIHYDITVAGATSWQWWTAISPYDYKDGLIYLDDSLSNGIRGNMPQLEESLKKDGVCRSSKMMWALGNYSRFVRPSMVRVGVSGGDANGNLLVSAYVGRGSQVIVVVNYDTKRQSMVLSGGAKRYKIYETSAESDLGYKGMCDADKIVIPARSVITLVAH